MSYFILPKINNDIIVKPKKEVKCEPYLSNSLLNYHDKICKQIQSCIINNDLSSNSLREDELIKIINPYEYIFTKVPCSKFSVSKLNPKTNLFYEFLEISTTLNIFDLYCNLKSINCLHVTYNNNDTRECLEMLRENFNDHLKCFDELNDETMNLIGNEKFDFMFFETKTNKKEYFFSIIEILMVVLKNQRSGGSCVIKINSIFHKPVVDFIYMMSSLYNNVYILKPNTSNVTTFEKFVICKSFKTSEKKTHGLNYLKLKYFLTNLEREKKSITSILECEIPCYFTCKIDDINIIVGRQQLESLNMIINILKNKNKEEKMEAIKKTSIQKSVSWCEKHKIPCNKFIDRINTFMLANK